MQGQWAHRDEGRAEQQELPRTAVEGWPGARVQGQLVKVAQGPQPRPHHC